MADDVRANNKAGKRLRPGGKRWFPRRLLPYLRKRKAGVDESSVKGKPKPLRLKALLKARGMLGVVERGGNNRGPEVEAIILANGGVIGEPWCGDAVAYWYRAAGSKVVTRSWAATRFLGRLGGMSSHGPRQGRPGDIIVFNFPGGHPDSDHTGLLVDYTNSDGHHRIGRTATHVKTIDGNVGTALAASDSQLGGDGIGYKIRPISLVSRSVRVHR